MRSFDPDPQGRYESYERWAEAEARAEQGVEETDEPADSEGPDEKSATAGVDTESLDQVLEDFGVSE